MYNKAFTLIELILTIVLIAIVVIPSSIFLVESMKGAFKAQDITVAANLARMELERVNNMLYGNISPIDILNYWGDDFSHPDLSRYDLRREITFIEGAEPPAEGVMEITVRVYPRGKLGSVEDLLATVITHRASYAD